MEMYAFFPCSKKGSNHGFQTFCLKTVGWMAWNCATSRGRHLWWKESFPDAGNLITQQKAPSPGGKGFHRRTNPCRISICLGAEGKHLLPDSRPDWGQEAMSCNVTSGLHPNMMP